MSKRLSLLHVGIITKWAYIEQLNVADNRSVEWDVSATKAFFISRTCVVHHAGTIADVEGQWLTANSVV